MAVLRYNPAKGMWYAEGLNQKIADDIGLDWSSPAGVYYTTCIYAALAMWDIADGPARDSMFLERMQVEASWATDYHGPRAFRVPPNEELMPFQKGGVAYCLDRTNTLIGDEPGLGKTAQAIVYANEIGAERVLVICPASVRLQWQQMIYRWIWPRNHRTKTGYPVTCPVLSGKSSIYRGPHPCWYIVSYDLLARSPAMYEMFLAMGYDLVICDEIHFLRSPEARRTQHIFGAQHIDGIAENAGAKLGLTGTPLPSRPRECYTVARNFCFDAIDRLSLDKFKAFYNESVPMPGGKVVEFTGRLPELQQRLRANFMVRRHKDDVLPQLPKTRYEIAYVEPNKGVRTALRAEKMLGIDPTDFQRWDADVQGQVATIRREMGEAKVPLVAEHVHRIMQELDKLVVYCWHKSVLWALAETLAEYQPVALPGGTTNKQKHERKEAFMRDPEVRLFLGNIAAIGTGTDGIQEVASMCVFAEPSWTPGENEQAVDRLRRIGQTGYVHAQFLVAPAGFDERVLKANLEKADHTHRTLDRSAL